ncbi:PAS domain S-box protein [Azospirillum rugosum]|uniref:histidine kinase n=1 Tax=Azospirillum rugosum TaxID=416170 RepID=A0ABS4SVB9_9PROT|nr:PAS domain S-box protein [Azospirillum rugosum]MBP2296518.1 PAS domain S-box-containing protein [Azospirillum rugosum]MDQ0530082.1 PAS domain S-box-containing protein [Azospirillum rugosum]
MTGALALRRDLGFLTGGGAMGALVRGHDWSATPLGPPETWTQSLRTVVNLMLTSGQAMFVAWGPELTFLYNDGYAPIFGAKHPAALGRPFHEVWSDIWPQFGPLVGRTLSGEALWHEDLLVPMERHGYREDAWFTFSYTPVRDDDGRIAGMFCAVIETTEHVLAKRRTAFHLELESRLRQLSDPAEVVAVAEEALGRHLGASRVGYGVMDETARYFTTSGNWTDGTVAHSAGTHDLAGFGPDVLATLRRGESLVVDDSRTDPRAATPDRQAAFGALEIGSVITASLVKNGRMAAALYVHDRKPRRWRPDEVQLVEEVAARTWSAVERAQAEASLRHANARLAAEGERLRELFRQAPGFMCVLRGRDHVFELANDAYHRLVGTRALIGRSVQEAFPEIADPQMPDQGFFQLLDRVYDSGEPFVGHALPVTLVRAPGTPAEERFVTFVYQPIKDAEGRVTGIFCEGSDVTAAKRSEVALRASEERLRIAQEAGGVGTFELSADGTLSVSDAFCHLWGIPPRPEVPMDELIAIIDPADRPRLNTLQRGNVPPRIFGYVEYRIHRPDSGEMRWIARRGQAVQERPDGPVRVIGVCFDITERKRAEEALRDLNATLERRVAERTADRDRMWRLSTDVMLVARFDGTITAVNPAWTALLGWTEADLLGTSFLDLVHPDDRAATAAESGHLASGRTTPRFENRYRHKDGSHRWLTWIAVPDDRFIHAVGRDITAQKEADAALQQAEEQLRQAQKMEAVGQLTGGVAHDFNNLLQALGGCLAMIERRSREPQVRPLLDAGQQAVARGAKLVQQLMAFARRDSLRPEPISVHDRVLGMTALLERALRADIRLETRFGAGLWPVEVDQTQFELAVINLAVNARDAMPTGGRLLIEAENVTLPPGDPKGLEGEFLRLSVTDTGSGMAPEVAARAFEPFFTTKELGKGTGLGLAQVYGFAQQAGGTACIDSEPGRGTAVTLLLRRSGTAPAAEAAPATAAANPAAPHRPGRVLVVEDDPVVAMTVGTALEDAGFSVLSAATADEAMPILSSTAVDVLFSDVVMPGSMSGVDLAREAQRLHPGLPVILATGYSEEIARAAGIPVLSKPYRIDDLVRRIDRALEAGRG